MSERSEYRPTQTEVTGGRAITPFIGGERHGTQNTRRFIGESRTPEAEARIRGLSAGAMDIPTNSGRWFGYKEVRGPERAPTPAEPRHEVRLGGIFGSADEILGDREKGPEAIKYAGSVMDGVYGGLNIKEDPEKKHTNETPDVKKLTETIYDENADAKERDIARRQATQLLRTASIFAPFGGTEGKDAERTEPHTTDKRDKSVEPGEHVLSI
jgi:hypothetical protein